MSHTDYKIWQCHMFLSILILYLLPNLRNGNVACHYRFTLSCSVTKALCCMSNLGNGHVAVSNVVDWKLNRLSHEYFSLLNYFSIGLLYLWFMHRSVLYQTLTVS